MILHLIKVVTLFCALLLSARSLFGMSLIESSPFIPSSFVPPSSSSATASQPPAPPSNRQIEFKGMYEIAGQPYFLIAERNQPGLWVNPHEEKSGFLVTGYDLEANLIQVRYQGFDLELELNELPSNPASMPIATASTTPTLTRPGQAVSNRALPTRRTIAPSSSRNLSSTTSSPSETRPPASVGVRPVSRGLSRLNRPQTAPPSHAPSFSRPPVAPPTSKPDMPVPDSPPLLP